MATIVMALIFGPRTLNGTASFVQSRLEKVDVLLAERQQLL